MKWETVNLGVITKNLDSKRIPLNSAQRAEKESQPLYPYIGANNIMGYIDEYIFDEKILCVAEDGGSWGSGENCAKIYNEKVWVNNHAHVLTENEKANLEFLMYYLNFADLTLYINGATRGKLTKSSLNSIKIPLPPIPTQKKIAAILDAANAYRQKTKALIEKYNQLAQALFLELFGDPVTNPKGWDIKAVGDVCVKIIGGGTPSKSKPEYYDGNVPWVTPKDMKFEYIITSIDKINQEAIDNSSANLIPAQSVLMVIRSGILKKKLPVAINSVPVTVNQDMKAFIPNLKLVTSEFLYSFFFAVQSYLLSKVRAVTADNIEFKQIKELNIYTPPLKLQNQFANRIQLIEQQKQQAQNSLQKAEDLFNSLLQRAFKGELVKE